MAPDSIQEFDLLPAVEVEEAQPGDPPVIRRTVLEEKRLYREIRDATHKDTVGMSPSSEKNRLYRSIRACADSENDLRELLDQGFMPMHSQTQFLSPRAFFVSPLFRVASKAEERKSVCKLNLPVLEGRAPIHYSGPELRQSDSRVFLSLLHMLRDVKLGTLARFEPEQVCIALFRRYDGNSRNLLRGHIHRLQKGLIISESFSVQLLLGFEYPKRGGWTVALDPRIVELFRVSPEVWLPMYDRLQLTDGLATWLLTFIESQTKLIPMRIARVRELCGSNAGDRAFTNSLRLAMKCVAATGLIETGWSLRNGNVRWLKKPSTTN